MEISESDSSDSLNYSIIKYPVIAEIKIKGSRFIARANPLETQEQCERSVTQMQRSYHDATHVCYAYRIGIGDESIFRYSDAGEPAGTAGVPIMQVIQGYDLTNILIVVIRYFGGTKLGIGGLIRSYTNATKAALQKAEIIRKETTSTLKFQFDYDCLNQIMRGISAKNVQIIRQDFSDKVKMTISAPLSQIKTLQQDLVDLTSAKITFIT